MVARKDDASTNPIFPERFVAILNGKLVLPLAYKNLGAHVKRGPVFGIKVQNRIHVALRTGKIGGLNFLFCLVTQVRPYAPTSASSDDDRHACAHNRRRTQDCHRESKTLQIFSFGLAN